jgi:hypothetical protein
MNIFIVDEHPVVAAQMLCDQHVVKMITEGAQMLSTCHRVLDGVMTKQPSNSGKRMVPRYKLDDGRDKVLYHAVHFKHPCNIWIREDISNYNWLLYHTHALCQEYTSRYKKTHACQSIVEYLEQVGAPFNMPVTHTRTQTFVQAMPDHYKDKDPVVAYRNFYIGSKSRFARWKYRKAPKWYTDATSKSVRSVSALRSNQKSLSDNIRLL